MVDERRPSLVLLDVWLHGSPMDGLEVLDAIKQREPELPVIIFSGHGNIDTAVSAVSRGAKRSAWLRACSSRVRWNRKWSCVANA